jgi:hypothetical protein
MSRRSSGERSAPAPESGTFALRVLWTLPQAHQSFLFHVQPPEFPVTLVSYGGRTDVAMQIGSSIRKRGISANTATARSGEHR